MRSMNGIKGALIGWVVFHISFAILGLAIGEFGIWRAVFIIPYIFDSFNGAVNADFVENVILMAAPVLTGFISGMDDKASFWSVAGYSLLAFVIAVGCVIAWILICALCEAFMENFLEAGLLLVLFSAFFPACAPVAIIIAFFDR